MTASQARTSYPTQKIRRADQGNNPSSSIEMAVPTYAQTSLTHLLSCDRACRILGEEDVRAVVKTFLRCISSLTKPNNSTFNDNKNGNSCHSNSVNNNNIRNANSMNNYEGLGPTRARRDIYFAHIPDHVIEEGETAEERYWTDIFTAALFYDFYNPERLNYNNNELKFQECKQKESDVKKKGVYIDGIPEWCIYAWHRMLNLPPPDAHISDHNSLSDHKSSQSALNKKNDPPRGALASVTSTISRARSSVRKDSVTQGPSYTSQVQGLQQNIPSPLLALDKVNTFAHGRIIPPPATPHNGVQGHMALMDCLFEALASPSPATFLDRRLSDHSSSDQLDQGSQGYVRARSSGSNAGNATRVIMPNNNSYEPRILLLLPDLLIFWGILRRFQYTFINNPQIVAENAIHNKSAVINSGAIDDSFQQTSNVEENKEERENSLRTMISLSFRLYDRYEKRGTISRDTIHRFLNDIHGEDSYKKPYVIQILDEMFSAEERPVAASNDIENHDNPMTRRVPSELPHLSEIQFTRAIFRTMRWTLPKEATNQAIDGMDEKSLASYKKIMGKPSHILLDWLATLGNATLPRFIFGRRKVKDNNLDYAADSKETIKMPSLQKLLIAKKEVTFVHDPDFEIRSLCQRYGIMAGSESILMRNRSRAVSTAIDRKVGIDSTVKRASEVIDLHALPPQISHDKSSVQEHFMDLFEVKRRFRSVVELNNNNRSIDSEINEKEEYETEKDECESLEEDSISKEGHHLPIDESEGKPSNSSRVINTSTESIVEKNLGLPRNVIFESTFLAVSSASSEESGNGGFLTQALAKLAFRAGCNSISDSIDANATYDRLDLELHGFNEANVSNGSLLSERKKGNISLEETSVKNTNLYWNMYDVLHFACVAVRRESVFIDGKSTYTSNSDLDLLKFAFSSFMHIPNEHNVEYFSNTDCNGVFKWNNRIEEGLSRAKVGKMLLLLIDHYNFRLSADSPTTFEPDHDRHSNTIILSKFNEKVEVNASAASLLGLLPPYVKQISDGNNKGTDINEKNCVSLNVLIDYVFSEASASNPQFLSFEEFCDWQLNPQSEDYRSLQSSEIRLGPYLLDLKLLGTVLFGVKPSSKRTERELINEIKKRHSYRYPETKHAQRGPNGTIWYVVKSSWWKTWCKYASSDFDNEKNVKRLDSQNHNFLVEKIDNNALLVDNGSLALRKDLRWKRDFELVPPLVWSALHAWYDGGPPIHRAVVPSSLEKSFPTSTKNNHILYEIEIYPTFVTVLLSDASSRGDTRPFQQYYPVSNFLPMEICLKNLCSSLDTDPNNGRLWMTIGSYEQGLDNASNNSNSDEWLIRLDANILDQIREKGIEDETNKNIILILELKTEEEKLWPRRNDGIYGYQQISEKRYTESPANILPLTGDGIVGLYNMGNTCYLNSSIQCLSHTPIFRDYFTSKAYLNDINRTNPLGHQGRLAQVSAVLINSLWKYFGPSKPVSVLNSKKPGSYVQISAPSITPKTFKEAMGKFNDHFAGNEQHDAQELLAFLLSGLSEDLNRIVDKPYIEAPDSDGRPDKELADIWWNNHLRREMSIIVVLFTGQYKSLLTCKSCGYESARFEPFGFLQLPLPEDDQIAIQLILFPLNKNEGKEKDDLLPPTKYSIRVRHDATLFDALIELSKILFTDAILKNDNITDDVKSSDAFDSDSNIMMSNHDFERNEPRKKQIYESMAKNMAVVRMGDGYIVNIIPNTYILSKLNNREGDVPLLHVFELDPMPLGKSISDKQELIKINQNSPSKNVVEEIPTDQIHHSDKDENENNDSQIKIETIEPSSITTHAFLAIMQRKFDVLTRPLMHPYSPKVFGIPLLLRVNDLEGYTGYELYDLVAKRMKNLVPKSILPFLSKESPLSKYSSYNFYSEREKSNVNRCSGRQKRIQTKLDSTSLLSSTLPRYGFQLRLTSRDGRKCALCPWYECCIGCVVPDDECPTIAMCGDSISLDWHMMVDIASGSFGLNPCNERLTSSQILQSNVKKHKTCNIGENKDGYRTSITLEGCLESFSKEERIPEAYCSKCQDFRVQTKKMSLWRLPPIMIIQLKRFQFTQHTRRKLRDLVIFPLEGLDFSSVIPATFFSDKDANISSDSLYDLYGVVHHQGALSGGHYVASLKSESDGQWRLFNDAQVYEINSQDVIDASAYILFYVRRDVKNASLEDFWDTKLREGEGMTEEEVESLLKQRERCIIS